MKRLVLFLISYLFLINIYANKHINLVNCKEFKTTLNFFQPSDEGEYDKVVSLMNDKKFREALKILKDLLTDNPKSSNLNFLMGVCSFQASDEKAASIYYLKKAARKIDKKFKLSFSETSAPPHVNFYLGFIYSSYGNYNKAIYYYNRFKKSADEKSKELTVKADEQIKNCQILISKKKYSYTDFSIEFDSNNIIRLVNLDKQDNDQNQVVDVSKIYPNFSSINSPFSEIDLVFLPDSSLVLSSDRPKTDKDVYEEGLCNVYMYKYSNGQLETGEFIKGINSIGDDQVNCISADGKTMYMQSDLDGSHDILISTLQSNGNWSEPVSIGKTINTKNTDEFSPFISSDGQTLFFVSVRKDGYGDKDIYFSKRKLDGTWSEPVNMGETINTMFDEETPFLTTDNKLFFFSSRGHNTYGGYDVFFSEFIDSAWTKPMNIGKKINSEKNELGYQEMSDKKVCYYSSNIGPDNGFDYIKAPRPKLKLLNLFDRELFANSFLNKGKILKVDSLPQKSTVFLFDKRTNRILAIESTSETGGEYFITAEKDLSYSVIVKTDDYLFYSHNDDISFDDNEVVYNYDKNIPSLNSNKGTSFDFVKKKDILEKDSKNMTDFEKLLAYAASDTIQNFEDYYDEEFVLENNLKLEDVLPKPILADANKTKDVAIVVPDRIQIGDSLKCSNVCFEYNSIELKQDAMKLLEKLAKALTDDSKMKIEIVGHTDNIGSDYFNMVLSQKRAKAVYEYFVSKKIKANRMTYKGMGESKPLDTNDTPEGRAKNRRTEIIIK